MSPIRVDDDLLPTTTFAIHLSRLDQPAGWLVGEFSLEEMWRMVDRIRIGEHGYAMVVAPNGELVAHGDPDKKALVAQSRNMLGHRLVQAISRSATRRPLSLEYADEDGRRELGVAARIATLGWTVIVEQPTSEAYASAAVLQRQLVVAIAVVLLGMISVGYLFGRQFITPILTLKRATQAVAAGQLDTRVDIRTGDEFADLGDAFNTMANRLVELQEDVKRQERQAMFGRVAAGLVHDLSHPVQNIGNSARLLARDDVDAEAREMFRRTIERELATLKRFMDDLRNIVKPRPIERFAMDVNGAVAEIAESMRPEGERTGVAVEAALRAGSRSSSRATASRSDACSATSSPTRFRRPSRAAAWRSRPRARRSRRDQRQRHRLRHPARAPVGDLRGFRDDQAPRARPRPGHLQAHRRTARRHDRRRKRGRPRHVVHAAVPGARRPIGAGGGKLSRSVASAAETGPGFSRTVGSPRSSGTAAAGP